VKELKNAPEVWTVQVGARVSDGWAWLVRPHPTFTQREEQRRARLLASLDLAVFLTVMIGTGILARLQATNLTDHDTALFLACAWVLLAAFAINRGGHYRLAAWLTVVPSTVVVIVAPFFPDSAGWVLTVTIAPVLLAAFIFSPRISMGVAGAILISATLLLIVVPMGKYQRYIYIDMLLFVAVLDAIILAFMFYQQGVEQERRKELEDVNAKLRESEARLEQRVIARTRELDEARAEAVHANEAKSRFLATVSHELRTPLNAIINFNQFVSSELYGAVNDRQRDALEKSTSSARHLLALINDVLDMSKIEAGRMDLVIEDGIDLRAEIDAVMATIQPLLEDKPVQLIVETADNLPAMRADRRRIRQVILNLMSNAAKFTDSGYIKLRVWHADKGICLAVEDTGPGISLEQQSVIFEPFRQLDRTHRSRAGTGLGLPISRSLVEAHGGELWLESQVGKGSTFFAAFPVNARIRKSEHASPQ
jgi:signal transduction histidine kinase